MNEGQDGTDHLEGIKLFFNLLCQHWCKAIASGNVTSSIVFATWPCIMKYDSWTKRNIPVHCPTWCARHTRRRAIGVVLDGKKVLVTLDLNRIGLTVTPWSMFVSRGAGST